IRPAVPCLSIGNITVGGTGKTPHTELVLRLCSRDMPMAVLSRGYGRSSKGFRYVAVDDCVADVGDEPLQIKRKFPEVVVAVNRNRIEGIRRIQKDHPQVKLVVLDDAFQYRKLTPTLSILLSPYSRPYTCDTLLPFGRLRDLPTQAKRAQVIMVSKTPPKVSSLERARQYKILKPSKDQQLLFSCYTYGHPRALFPRVYALDSSAIVTDKVIAITGIAHPESFLAHIGEHARVLEHLKFPDHHRFTHKDALRIHALQAKYPGIPIYTTEKDALRLYEIPCLNLQVQAALYYIPLQVELCSPKEHGRFVELITELCN
ncbi:MAG: tetraacyldisaccharide 4'-kinase, partial [Bacteroidales bacterium]|nr:tetraacyldisaccharide 4'-kinase [Bacteroidales bacterium]